MNTEFNEDYKNTKAYNEALKYFKHLDKVEKSKRIQFADYIKDKYKLPTIERAEAWLIYLTENFEVWGDQEALIYFLSRGHSLKNRIDEIIQLWKAGEQNSFDACAGGSSIYYADSKKSQTIGEIPIEEAKDILRHSSFKLPNFWHGNRHQEYSIDATMLRVYEWTKIGGFDEWFTRFTNDQKEILFHGGFSTIPGCFWLFNMCRSNLAIKIMPKVLDTALEALKVPIYSEYKPWYIMSERGQIGERRMAYVVHPVIAAILVFVSHRLYANENILDQDLIAEANNTLIKYQNSKGCWNLLEDNNEVSIETTSICIHALSISKPNGWEHSVSKAKTWLESMQKKDGYWHEASSPDSVYLTVLVLDALELANGKSNTTFNFFPLSNKKAVSDMTGFKVGFSFPGEVRERVSRIAEMLSEVIGKENIFYDNYYTAQLARPNLDIFLQQIYHKEIELIVVFIGSDYETKTWCNLEWRAIRDLITKRESSIMFIKYDDGDISGIFSHDGYIDMIKTSDEQIVGYIIERMN